MLEHPWPLACGSSASRRDEWVIRIRKSTESFHSPYLTYLIHKKHSMSYQDFSMKSYSTGESNWILLPDSDWLTFSSPDGEKKKTLDKLMERGQDMFGLQVP